ncbi:hypothetical protein SC206_10500 [Rouxiella sp. T17]|uniref:hypothetical protein n=1 Tax=Rouxiella sp. T17 TaxID=3085684 RepID=UPI002FC63173
MAQIRNEGTAKPRDLRHAREHLERSTDLVLKLQLWKKSSDSKGPSDCGPLGGMGRRPLSEANAVELELELEFELKFEFKKFALRFPNLKKDS